MLTVLAIMTVLFMFLVDARQQQRHLMICGYLTLSMKDGLDH